MSAPHGTRARYVSARCRCAPCRKANSRYQKRHELSGTDLVDASRVREHLAALRAAGVGRREVARRSGVAVTVVARLLGVESGRPALRVRPATQAAILAVSADALAPGALVPAGGSMWRLRALVAFGWPQSALARALGMTATAVSKVCSGVQVQVTRSTADAVRALFEERAMVPGPSDRARRFAAGRGWVPPLGIDDDLVDGPGYCPGDCRRSDDRARLTADDVDELVGWGESLDGIGARFGVRAESVRRLQLRRDGAA